MKVLIVAEGEHELHGALQTLTERLCPHPLECTLKSSIHDQPRTRRKVRLKGGAFKKKSLAWLIDAQEDHFEALVFLIDFDRGEDARIKQLDEAQEFRTPEFHLSRAFGVAIRSFDAWMLADEKALSEVFERVIDRPSNPENFKDPKSELREIAQGGGDSTRGHRHDYLLLAEKVDLSTLEARCPKGFKPFADRVRKLNSP